METESQNAEVEVKILTSVTTQPQVPGIGNNMAETSTNVEKICGFPEVVEMEKIASHINGALDTDVLHTKVTDISSARKKNNGPMIQHTKVEAFIKMVVCRKIIVQKLSIKTGKVLHTTVKIEEDPPVVLNVHSTETSEPWPDDGKTDDDQPLVDSVNPQSQTSNTACISLPEKSGDSNGIIALEPQADMDSASNNTNAADENLTYVLQELEATGIPAKQLSIKSEGNKSSSTARTVDKVTANKAQTRIEQRSIIMAHKQKANKVQNTFSIDRSEQMTKDDVLTPVNRKRGRPPRVIKKPRKFESGDEEEQREITLSDEFKESAVEKEEEKEIDDDKDWTEEPDAKPTVSQLLKCSSRICKKCGREFASVAQCAKHLKLDSCSKVDICKICGRNFGSEEMLERHMLSHRDFERVNGQYHCRDCTRVYATRNGYLKHKRQGTCFKRDNIFEDGTVGDFQCEICNICFRTENFLRLHKDKVHDNPENGFQCKDCSRKFYSRQGFLKHVSTKSCTVPLRCLVCGKTYSNKARDSFKMHMKHHRAEADGVQFQCEECGRVYLTEEALRKHRLKHTGVRPYKCETCGKAFPMRYMVRDHMRTHTGEKPFLCNVCGTSFNNRGHLYRHIRSHTSGTLHKRGRPKKCNLYTVKPSTNHDSISISEEIAGDGFDMVEIKTDSSQDHQRLASSSVMTPTYITVHTTPAQMMLDGQVIQHEDEAQLQQVVMQTDGMSDPMVIQVIHDLAGGTAYQVSEGQHIIPALSLSNQQHATAQQTTHSHIQHIVVSSPSQQ